MADFQFRTRGQQSPQGKQRVYFTCHPDDFERFFEEIQKEILDRQDCAVFYLEPGIQPEDVEDYELRLREMQLFVVPVTTKMLTRANRAMDVEVPFAFENHIPVLPLMQEGGLDDVFNKKFGDLQYLYNNDTDPTAIPYEKKLTKYLESVIVGDELAKKVRAAFDAYIFLSYRKKDRKYAQELMKLIHSNPLCRDIAIWYDEFLTPGENFNEAIRAALEKSELFALAVTPNLINEINYILTTEYPMARDLGKTILPAEMEQTDREKLQSMYDAIPELIEKGDTTALANRLSSLFESLAIRENDIDPQHNFFIGLAYLGGIDVEVNHERAVALISGSAEQGYIPSIEKLVSMYKSGDGVNRDYYIAVAWQEKLVEQHRKNYEEAPNEDNAGWLLSNLCDLGDAYTALGQLSMAQKTYEKIKRCSESFVKQHTNKQFVRYQSVSYGLLGNIAGARGKLNEAEEWYRKALAIHESLAKETNTLRYRRDLSVSYGKLGEIAQACGKLSEAEKWYRKGLAIAESLAEETSTVQSRRDLSLSYNYLGDIAQARGKLNEAEEWYHKSLTIREYLAEETNTAESRRDLSVSCEKLGDIAHARGKLSEAEEWYRKSLSGFESIYKETNTIESRRSLSVSYDRLGDIAQARGKLNEAEEWYRKSLTIRESLAEETNTVQSCRDLFVSCNKLGDIAEARGKLSEAEKWYRKSLAIDESLVEETNTVQSRRDLSVILNRLGDIAKVRRKLNEAEKWYRKSLAIRESLVEEANTEESRHGLSLSYERLGEIAKAYGKLSEAEEWYRKSLAVRESLAEETNTVQSRRDLSTSCDSLGNIAKAQGKLSEAEEWFRKGLAIREFLRKETDTVVSRRDLSVSYTNLGVIAEARGELREAEEWCRKCLAILDTLAVETKTLKSYDDLAVSYYNIGYLLHDSSYLEKALNIWMQLAAQCPDNPSFRQRADIVKRVLRSQPPDGSGDNKRGFESINKGTNTVESRRSLFVSYIMFGDVAQARGKLSEAEEWYRKSLAITESLADETNTVLSRRDLSVSFEKLGDNAQACGKLSETEEWYRKCLAIRESLAEETNTVESRRDLSVSYIKLGDIAKARGKLSEAEEWYHKSHAVRETLAEETNTVESRHDLSVSCNKLGDIAQALGKLSEAEEWYRKGLDIAESLAKETNTLESYDDLAVSYFKMGCLLHDRSCLAQALDIWTQLAAQCPDNPSFQQRADIVKKQFDKGHQSEKHKGEFISDDEEMKLTVVNDEGKKIECDVLFTFESKETGKSYIVYTDDTLDEEGNTKVYASIIDTEADGEEPKLIPIESDEEWAVIETILDQIQEDALDDDEEE